MSFAETINDMMRLYFLLFIASVIIAAIWVAIQLWKDKHRKFHDTKDDFN